MRSNRLVGWITAALALALAPDALARAGSGSSSFGGGGGGGGFGGGFSGGGGGGYRYYGGGGGHTGTEAIIVGIVIGLFLLYMLFAYMRAKRGSGTSTPTPASSIRQRVAGKRAENREQRVRLAAAEAAEDDPIFAPDAVHAAAVKLFTDIQAAWSENDVETMRGLVGGDLLAEWELRLGDFARKGWNNRVEIVTSPQVRYVGLTNKAGDDQDRVVVWIDAQLRDYVVDRSGQHIDRGDASSENTTAREYWTLLRKGDAWIVESIEQPAEGAHVLTDELIATPSDDGNLRDESLLEGAVADAVPAGVKIAEVADLDFDGEARAAANDLSLADGRFAPDVLEVAARRAVAAWAAAIDGDDAQLAGIADANVIQELLHPGDPSGHTRVVVRGPKIEKITIVALDAAVEPARMALQITIHGARYIQNRDTAAVVSGSDSRATTFTEHWTMALSGDDKQPWRVARVRAPVGRS